MGSSRSSKGDIPRSLTANPGPSAPQLHAPVSLPGKVENDRLSLNPYHKTTSHPCGAAQGPETAPAAPSLLRLPRLPRPSPSRLPSPTSLAAFPLPRPSRSLCPAPPAPSAFRPLSPANRAGASAPPPSPPLRLRPPAPGRANLSRPPPGRPSPATASPDPPFRAASAAALPSPSQTPGCLSLPSRFSPAPSPSPAAHPLPSFPPPLFLPPQHPPSSSQLFSPTQFSSPLPPLLPHPGFPSFSFPRLTSVPFPPPFQPSPTSPHRPPSPSLPSAALLPLRGPRLPSPSVSPAGSSFASLPVPSPQNRSSPPPSQAASQLPGPPAPKPGGLGLTRSLGTFPRALPFPPRLPSEHPSAPLSSAAAPPPYFCSPRTSHPSQVFLPTGPSAPPPCPAALPSSSDRRLHSSSGADGPKTDRLTAPKLRGEERDRRAGS
nr:uncharacterized protein LOC129485491 [Symphalangus syndactylus]